MSKYVLDASALLALLRREPGYEKVAGVLDDCTIGAVNLAEVLTKLIRKGVAARTAEQLVRSLELPVTDWSEHLAYRSTAFAELAWTMGLSFGDRACLTLAAVQEATAVTADVSWRAQSRVPVLAIR